MGKYALFVSFFPQIVQGPISRYNELAAQLTESHQFNAQQIKYGAQLILWGLFKKLVIADRIAIAVDIVFHNYTQLSGLTLFAGSFFYCIQIYCDFSGGIDIARGASSMLGIELPINFSRPFFATSIADFWRRWHITLSSWLREYVFYPLSLSRSFARLGKQTRRIFGSYLGKLIPIFLAMLITFMLVGIWHGANWKYVAYGLYNGGLLFLGILLDPLLTRLVARARINPEWFAWRLVKMAGTTFLVVIGRFFAHSADLLTALRMIKRAFKTLNLQALFDGTFLNLGLDGKEWGVLAVALFILLVAGILQEKGYKLREKIAGQNIAVRWAFYYTAIFIIIIFGLYGIKYSATDFIYMGF